MGIEMVNIILYSTLASSKEEINDVCLSQAFTIAFVDSLAALGIAQTSLALLSFGKAETRSLWSLRKLKDNSFANESRAKLV